MIEWCDRHLCHVTGSGSRVTKCMHMPVVDLRLEDNLVITIIIIIRSSSSSSSSRLVILQDEKKN